MLTFQNIKKIPNLKLNFLDVGTADHFSSENLRTYLHAGNSTNTIDIESLD